MALPSNSANPTPGAATAGREAAGLALHHLFLVGMPGAGKTTLGRALATLYSLPFRDLDEELVQRAGRSIPDIFAQDGEAYFRQLEADTLRAVVAEHERLVLATGGGTPCFHDNMAVLNHCGITLWLDVPVHELLARLRHAAATRPLLAALPDPAALEARLRETLRSRQRFYQLAALRCAAEACTPEAVQHLLARFLATG